MNKKKTHEEYVEELKIKNPAVTVIDKYINAKTAILHHCETHDVFWKTTPSNVLQGRGCDCCGKSKIGAKNRKSHDEYIARLQQINPNIEVIGIYKNNKTAILHRCIIDNHEWMSRPDNILSGKGCPLCRNRMIGNMFRKNHNWYVEQLSKLFPEIEVIEEYVGNDVLIAHKCRIDGTVWMSTPHNILRGIGCPECGGYSGEKIISQWLNDHQINYITQYRFTECKDKKPLPFDFYLPEYNTCIEYDGRQHFMPIDFAGKGVEWADGQFAIVKYHDDIKNKYCQDNNIHLLRIPYFKNIEEELENFYSF